MAKKTITKAKVVRKSPAAKIVRKAPAKTVTKKAVAVKKVIKVKPLAKAVEKGEPVKKTTKSGVRPAKKLQTAEGWKRNKIKEHLAKKTK